MKDEEIDNMLEYYDDSDPDYSEISSKYGIDINSLTKELENYNGKLNVNYMLTSEDSVGPQYAYETDSGFDLYSIESIHLPPFGRCLVPTGLHVDIPENHEIQVRSKSGLAINQGLMVLNSPGTVDYSYLGEIKVIVFNASNTEVTIKKGQKIAQAVVCPVVSGKWLNFNKVNTLGTKERGENGFGSTGIYK